MKLSFGIPIVTLAAFVAWTAGCERTVTTEGSSQTGADANSCFTCHNGDGRLEQAEGEWDNSIHASGNNIDYTNRGGGSDCTRCHDHQGFVDFLETGAINAPYDVVSAIHCHTCHSPHETGNFELRTTAPFVLANNATFDHGKGNLCVNCHHARASETAITTTNFQITNSRFGPHHGPQGDMIQGTNMYTRFPGYVYATSTHANAVRDACAGCHMGNEQTHDGYKVGGHSFNMVDEETGSNLVRFCTPCHATATSTYDFTANQDYDGDTVIEGYQTELDGLAATLRALLVGEGLLNNSTGLAIVQTVADGHKAGALWNYVTYTEDQSRGIHNFKYISSVLKASIAYLEAN